MGTLAGDLALADHLNFYKCAENARPAISRTEYCRIAAKQRNIRLLRRYCHHGVAEKNARVSARYVCRPP